MNGRLELENKITNDTFMVLAFLPDFVEDWYYQMKASSKTASSIRDYIYKVKKYLLTINSNTRQIQASELTYNSVVNYMSSIKTKKNNDGELIATSGSYQKTVWAALNSFFGFLKKRKYVEENPLEDIDISRKSDKVRIDRNRKFLTIEDFRNIIRAIEEEKNEITKAEHKAILLVLMCTGIRRRALTQINIEDIDFEKGILNVIDKEDAERDCYLTQETIEAIKEYLNYRKLKNADSNALFLSRENRRYSENGIRLLVRKYSIKGLGYPISPHKIRAGFCTILYEQTKDIRFVQETVGHSSVNTTQKYTVINNNNKSERICKAFNGIA